MGYNSMLLKEQIAALECENRELKEALAAKGGTKKAEAKSVEPLLKPPTRKTVKKKGLL